MLSTNAPAPHLPRCAAQCGVTMVSRYQKRVSGRLMDRSAQPPCGIDIHVEVPAVKYEKLSDDRLGEPSAVVRARVEAAREIQRWRFEGTAMGCNADSARQSAASLRESRPRQSTASPRERRPRHRRP